MPICGNFVCAFSYTDHGKVYCNDDVNWKFDKAPDCTATSQNKCEQYKYFSCKICGYEYKCFTQHDKGIFYSAENGSFIPKSSTEFAEAVQRNELINAKRDICVTAVSDFFKGHRKSTTVRKLYDKYGKTFPQFTKEYLLNAVEKSIVMYLEHENNHFKERF